MTSVIVLGARRLPADAEALAVCDVELDACLSVRGVEIRDDPVHGGQVALSPRRPWGDHERVLAWSPRVGAAIIAAVKHALGDHSAIVGDAAPDSVARFVFRDERTVEINGQRVPEAAVPSHALPAEPDDAGKLGRPPKVTTEAVLEAITDAPGIRRKDLAALLEVTPTTITRRTAELGDRVRAEYSGARGGWSYWPTERDR